MLSENESFKTQDTLYLKCFCGREFQTTLARFKHYGKTKCDVCSGHHLDGKYVSDYLKQYNAELLSDYKDTSQKLDIRCECGEIFQTTFKKIRTKNKVKCNKCTIGRENSTHLTVSEVDEVLRKVRLERLSEYENSTQKIKVKCRCGREFSRSFNKIRNGQVLCPACSKANSKIELLASEYLQRMHVLFKEQYCFRDLKTRNNIYLRFDFALFDKDKNLLCLIELDGEQHFMPVESWGGKDGFERRKKLDKLKDDYCALHRIKLYRIPYFKFNKIYEELENILNMKILCQIS